MWISTGEDGRVGDGDYRTGPERQRVEVCDGWIRCHPECLYRVFPAVVDKLPDASRDVVGAYSRVAKSRYCLQRRYDLKDSSVEVVTLLHFASERR